MIIQNAFNQEQMVENLLYKSLLHLNPKEIHSWMENSFDGSNMFCFYESETLVSILQIKRTQIKFKEQKIGISCIEMAATLPDYQNKGYFKALLDSFLDQASHNELFSFVYTKSPKLFESRSFFPLYYTKSYWIPSNICKRGIDQHVFPYREGLNLYPLYKEFMKHFDGSLYYTEEEFNQMLVTAKSMNKKIITVKDENEKLIGFASYKRIQNYIKVDTIIYQNGNAILDILKFLSYRCEMIQLITSQNERIDKLLPVEKPKEYAYVLFRLNNYKLISSLTGQDIRNVYQAFDLLEKPEWNHLFQD